MNKKGFVLIETLVVTMFVLLTFSILYSNAVPLLGKYKEISRYNGIDTTYDLYHVKKFLVKDPKYNSIFDSGHKIITCNNQTIYNQTTCNMLLSNLGIDEVNDELIFLKANSKDELLNDNNISEEVKDYIKSLELVSDILILQNDGYISYVDLELASSSPRDPILPNIPDDDYPEESLRTKLLEKINNSTCNPVSEDYNSKTNTTIKYLSGSADCINFNYVWYSGKLWQITSINSDGTIKMIMASGIAVFNYTTQSSIYASSTEVYQWLNEDFKDTLYNYQNIIVQKVNWDATSNLIEACKDNYYDFEAENGPECYIPKNPDSVTKQTKVVGDVGLLNAYEDYQSYKNLMSDDNDLYDDYGDNGFLHTDVYNYATLTINKTIGYAGDGQYETENVVYRMGRGNIGIDQSFIIRPVVVLKADILTDGGNGTIDSPFRLKGDKEKVISNTTSLNSRLNGEYVLFAGETYRILSVENNATKLLKVINFQNDTGEIKKFFANDYQYGTMFPTTDYWDYYLNNNWYNSIEERYQKMMVQGIYYLGAYKFQNYKSTICQKVDSKTTKACTKTTATWTGYVGLPRIGETIFMNGDPGNFENDTVFISPYDNNNNLEFNSTDLLQVFIDKNFYSQVAARPVITLSPDVVITAGNGRSPETAFRIALKS